MDDHIMSRSNSCPPIISYPFCIYRNKMNERIQAYHCYLLVMYIDIMSNKSKPTDKTCQSRYILLMGFMSIPIVRIYVLCWLDDYVMLVIIQNDELFKRISLLIWCLLFRKFDRNRKSFWSIYAYLATMYIKKVSVFMVIYLECSCSL